MHCNALTIGVVTGLVAWRCIWLVAGVPDTTAMADAVRTEVQLQLNRYADPVAKPGADQIATAERWRVSLSNLDRAMEMGEKLNLVATGVDVWDINIPIWVTPGRDGCPGWAGWDDNNDNIIDDAGELGAAWSDDHCVVQIPGDAPPGGRVIDHGGFRPVGPSENVSIARYRFELGYIWDAP